MQIVSVAVIFHPSPKQSPSLCFLLIDTALALGSNTEMWVAPMRRGRAEGAHIGEGNQLFTLSVIDEALNVQGCRASKEGGSHRPISWPLDQLAVAFVRNSLGHL